MNVRAVLNAAAKLYRPVASHDAAGAGTPPPATGNLPSVVFKKPRWRACATTVAAAIVTIVFARVASFAPASVEQYYVNGVGATFARTLSTISGVVPFSIAEPIMFLFACWLVLPAIPALVTYIQGRRGMRNAVECGAARSITAACFLVVFFYAGWGLNYSRAALHTRLDWDDSSLAVLPRLGSSSERDELVALCTQLVFVTNHYYTIATGTPHSETHSTPRASLRDLDHALDIGYERATNLLCLDKSFATARGPAKPVLASRVISRLGIAGFYSPFTGEANYNRDMSAFQIVHTIAHEKAHQRCIANEDEANFLGFLACVLSDDPYARYAGYLFAQRQLMGELIKIDPAAVGALVTLRCKGVQSDVTYSKIFWHLYGGPAQNFGHAMNDAYLKANRVEGGAFSYQMSARLLVLLARKHGGTCVLEIPSAA
ncbi:MAG: DUF3810 domain-containing protein [Candidatus Hydrogenedentes bacterium]|nr:DUF3810 domain-containing protein [Candidatus Hydrogenedentota bacterium]